VVALCFAKIGAQRGTGDAEREGGMSTMPWFQHVESRCLQCNYKLDGSTHVQGGAPSLPEEGDASVCLNCGQVLTYDAELHLRKITVRELGELMAENPEGWATIEKAQMFIRQRGRFR
jgi:hypothetical protein